MNASHDRSSEVQHPQYHQLEVNNSNSNQHLIASPAKNLDHTEQTNISEKSPSQSNHEAIQGRWNVIEEASKEKYHYRYFVQWSFLYRSMNRKLWLPYNSFIWIVGAQVLAETRSPGA